MDSLQILPLLRVATVIVVHPPFLHQKVISLPDLFPFPSLSPTDETPSGDSSVFLLGTRGWLPSSLPKEGGWATPSLSLFPIVRALLKSLRRLNSSLLAEKGTSSRSYVLTLTSLLLQSIRSPSRSLVQMFPGAALSLALFNQFPFPLRCALPSRRKTLPALSRTVHFSLPWFPRHLSCFFSSSYSLRILGFLLLLRPS